MTNETQYLLASIVESSQDSIVSIDLDRIVTSWNKGAEDLYGYPAGEVIGKPLEVVMLPKDIEDLISKVAMIVHELTVPIYETVRLHKNGKQADLEILLSPVRNAAGAVVGVSTVARDITVRKMQEQQKDEFISVASHELKTPLTSVKAYTEIILEQFERSGDDVSVSMIKKLHHQVDKLIHLVKTLLDTTKLAAGELLLDLELFDLNALIEEQIETAKMLSAKHDFKFTPGKAAPVFADRKLIGQVLTNLLSNASKYSPKGGEIVIACRKTEDGIEASVQDFGLGIPYEAKDKVFERYFRHIPQHAADIGGMGLGLYISAGIIRQHGGTMSVQSKEGEGSTFFFSLPLDGDNRKTTG